MVYIYSNSNTTNRIMSTVPVRKASVICCDQSLRITWRLFDSSRRTLSDSAGSFSSKSLTSCVSYTSQYTVTLLHNRTHHYTVTEVTNHHKSMVHRLLACKDRDWSHHGQAVYSGLDNVIIHCVQKKNTHSHFLSYLHEWCVDLNKNCSDYT